MHPNPAFRQEPDSRSLAFARDRAFGTLIAGGAEPLLSHVPFLLSEDGATAEMHLVRSNPIARAGGGAAILAVTGPDAYVSPDWYGVADQVPTWNYVAVHLHGRLEPLPEDGLRAHLDRLSAAQEGRLLPKPPWTSAKMTPDVLARMMRQIVPFRLIVEEVRATWKLSQNKPRDVRLRAADRLAGRGDTAMAALVRGDITQA